MSSDGSLTQIAGGDMFASYPVAKARFDELLEDSARPRVHWRGLHAELVATNPLQIRDRLGAAERQIREIGITYNVYADPKGHDRPWDLDVLPMMISAEEWESIEQGIEATDDECRVGLGGWAEGVVDAEVEPNRSCGQPQATASGERCGLVDFGEFEEVNVERPRQILSSRRDCHLHVVEGEDDWYHVCSVPEDWVVRTSEPPWFEAPLQRG